MPSVYALEAHMHDFHRELLSVPFPYVIDFNIHDLAQAALKVLGQAHRCLSSDCDLVLRPDQLVGERTVIKVRRDCWHGSAALTIEDILSRLDENPSLTAFMRQIMSEGRLHLRFLSSQLNSTVDASKIGTVFRRPP